MAYNDWATVVLHYGDSNPVTPPYQEAVIAGGINTATNYGTQTLGLVAPRHKYRREGETYGDVNGELFDDRIRRRLSFSMELYPFDFATGGAWDLDAYATLDANLSKPFKWIELQVSEFAYHTAGYAIPVVLESEPELSVEKEYGTRTVVLPLLHKYSAD